VSDLTKKEKDLERSVRKEKGTGKVNEKKEPSLGNPPKTRVRKRKGKSKGERVAREKGTML